MEPSHAKLFQTLLQHSRPASVPGSPSRALPPAIGLDGEPLWPYRDLEPSTDMEGISQVDLPVLKKLEETGEEDSASSSENKQSFKMGDLHKQEIPPPEVDTFFISFGVRINMDVDRELTAAEKQPSMQEMLLNWMQKKIGGDEGLVVDPVTGELRPRAAKLQPPVPTGKPNTFGKKGGKGGSPKSSRKSPKGKGSVKIDEPFKTVAIPKRTKTVQELEAEDAAMNETIEETIGPAAAAEWEQLQLFKRNARLYFNSRQVSCDFPNKSSCRELNFFECSGGELDPLEDLD